MNKATVILAIVGVALLATALVGITYAQFATSNPTATPVNPSARHGASTAIPMFLRLTATTEQTKAHLTAITATDTGLDATVTGTERKDETRTSTGMAAA